MLFRSNYPVAGTNGTSLAPIGTFAGTNNTGGLAINYSPDGTNLMPSVTIGPNSITSGYGTNYGAFSAASNTFNVFYGGTRSMNIYNSQIDSSSYIGLNAGGGTHIGFGVNSAYFCRVNPTSFSPFNTGYLLGEPTVRWLPYFSGFNATNAASTFVYTNDAVVLSNATGSVTMVGGNITNTGVINMRANGLAGVMGDGVNATTYMQMAGVRASVGHWNSGYAYLLGGAGKGVILSANQSGLSPANTTSGVILSPDNGSLTMWGNIVASTTITATNGFIFGASANTNILSESGSVLNGVAHTNGNLYVPGAIVSRTPTTNWYDLVSGYSLRGGGAYLNSTMTTEPAAVNFNGLGQFYDLRVAAGFNCRTNIIRLVGVASNSASASGAYRFTYRTIPPIGSSTAVGSASTTNLNYPGNSSINILVPIVMSFASYNSTNTANTNMYLSLSLEQLSPAGPPTTYGLYGIQVESYP